MEKLQRIETNAYCPRCKGKLALMKGRAGYTCMHCGSQVPGASKVLAANSLFYFFFEGNPEDLNFKLDVLRRETGACEMGSVSLGKTPGKSRSYLGYTFFPGDDVANKVREAFLENTARYVLEYSTNRDVEKVFGKRYGYSLFKSAPMEVTLPLEIKREGKNVSFITKDGKGFKIRPKQEEVMGDKYIFLTKDSLYVFRAVELDS